MISAPPALAAWAAWANATSITVQRVGPVAVDRRPLIVNGALCFVAVVLGALALRTIRRSGRQIERE